LKQPVPRPTVAMLEQNKAEEAARRDETTMAAIMGAFGRHPDVSATTNVGQPTLQDQPLVDARDIVQAANEAITGKSSTESLNAKVVKTGAPPPSEEAPTTEN